MSILVVCTGAIPQLEAVRLFLGNFSASSLKPNSERMEMIKQLEGGRIDQIASSQRDNDRK